MRPSKSVQSLTLTCLFIYRVQCYLHGSRSGRARSPSAFRVHVGGKMGAAAELPFGSRLYG